MASVNVQLISHNSIKLPRTASLVLKKLQFGMESSVKPVLQEAILLNGVNLA